jgi:branched-chain amino acid transport system permease protein
MLQALVSGILIGGIYGLFSVGFSLAFGVMRIVNFAHGDIVMVAMYATLFAGTLWGVDPIFMIIAVPILTGALGMIIYSVVFRRYVGAATLQQFLAAIALAFILQSAATMAFSPDARSLRVGWGAQYLVFWGLFVSYAQVIAFFVACLSVGALEFVLHKTRWGQVVRAVADDAEAVKIVGQNAHAVNLTAFGLSTALAGVAGAILVTFYPVNPQSGFALMPIALIATVLGGLGSIGGAFLGGLICGVIQQLASYLGSAALQDVPLYILLLIILAFRPYGLFGKKGAL